MRLASAFVRRALVATTAIVVFSPAFGAFPEGRDCPHQHARVGEALAILGAHTGDDGAGRRIDDVADGVDRDQRGDDQAVRKRDCRGAHTGLHRAVAAGGFANRRTGSGADVAFSHCSVSCRGCRTVPAVGGRSDTRVAAKPEVHQDRSWRNRNNGAGDLEADLLLRQVTRDAIANGEPIGASAGEKDRIDVLDTVHRVEQGDIACAGRSASLCDTTDRAVAVHDDDRASSRPLAERVVADLQSRDGGETSVCRARHGRSPLCERHDRAADCQQADDDRRPGESTSHD